MTNLTTSLWISLVTVTLEITNYQGLTVHQSLSIPWKLIRWYQKAHTVPIALKPPWKFGGSGSNWVPFPCRAPLVSCWDCWKAGGGNTTDKKRPSLCTDLALTGELQLQQPYFISWEQIQGPHLSSHRLGEQHSHPHFPVSWSRVVKPSGFHMPKCTANPGTQGAKKHPEWMGLKKTAIPPSSLLPPRLRVECKSNLSYLCLLVLKGDSPL